ncbi:MAG: hypothetical protein Q7T54_05990 [Candidatus Levybacteria bacterium]|nr:hypothetical protein [Candidatus Levybacteria bacterium]
MIDKPKVPNIQDSIQKTVEYLLTQQGKDGSFVSLSSENPEIFDNALQFHSTFSTSLILSSLSQVEKNKSILKIQKKAAAFLLSQKSTSNAFNYWARESVEAKKMPYPDDLDDTCCAWAALLLFDKKLVSGAVLAKIVALLNATEVNEGGPYRTWIVSDTADRVWLDVDVAVNSNVAYFLSLLEIELPNVLRLIENCIKEDKLASPYYPTIFPIIYFISRFYKGKYTNILTDRLFSEIKRPLNSLDTALIVCSLLNFKVPVSKVEKLIGSLLKEVEKGFSPHPFYTGVNPKRNKTYYAGASSLTTAFVIEAFAKYLKAIAISDTKKNKRNTKLLRIQKKVIEKVELRFENLPHEVKKHASSAISDIIKMDAKNQITHLPYVFYNTLKGKNKSLPPSIHISLGAATTYGWVAYTIYDDFFDEEGNPATLSVANIALREMSKIFYEVLPDNLGFQKLFCKVMDDLDSSNIWEVTNCRIPVVKGKIDLKNIKIPGFGNYEMLFQRSLGHALGPLAVLFLLGYDRKSSEVEALLSFFKHYLISRQLNDDAHDWEKDLKAGQVSPVVAMILENFIQKNKKNASKVLSFRSMNQFQKIFWYEVILSVCDLIDRHVREARTCLKGLAHLSDTGYFEELLVLLDHGTAQARAERESTLEFIASYKNS